MGLVFTRQHWLAGLCFHAGLIPVKYMDRWRGMVSMLSLSEGLLSIQTFRCVDVSLLRAPMCSSQMEQIIPLCGLWISKYSGWWWGGSFFRNCFEKGNLKAKQHKVHLYKQFSPLEVPLYRDNSSLSKKGICKQKSAEKVHYLCGHQSGFMHYLHFHNPMITLQHSLIIPWLFIEQLFSPSLFNIKSNL